MKLKIIALLLCMVCAAAAGGSDDLTALVNPFIGTAGGGNTFPGAVRPWGMVSVSPHTAPSAPSGYLHNEPFCYGFGMVHLSGTGCSDLGSIIVAVSRGEVDGEPESYKCTYAEEKAQPGYYECLLQEAAVRIQATATDRCGLLRLIPQQDGIIHLLVDVGRNLSRIGGGSVTMVAPDQVEGYNIGGGFCGESNRHKVYFSLRLNAPSWKQGIWEDGLASDRKEAQVEEKAIGGWLRYSVNKDQPVLVKIGISYVSIANARENLHNEIPDWDFNAVRKSTRDAWQQELARVTVSGGSHDDRVKFYTALYHALIHPNIISDVNGEYPLMGDAGTGRHPERPRYSVYSLWDTYRTLHPWLTLVYPERQSAMIQSMLDIYQESGFLPKWELAGDETFMMVGDGATPVIADSYIKGIRDFDIQAAYQAMRKPVFHQKGESAPPIRAGYHEHVQYKFIPFEQDTSTAWWVWGPVSTTLEYNYADWTLAQVAKQLGETADAEELLQRSLWYKNLFDAELQLLRPRLKNGAWLTPYDPLATEGSGYWSGSGGPGFVEGNAWNYTWFVPHDVPGLIGLFGGPGPFTEKLQACFDTGQFTINNEPDIAFPYLFTWVAGEYHRTRRIVTGIMQQQFKNSPDGLPGNDDCGAISAWFLFSALGFYPVCPAAPEYRLGRPLFERAEIHLNRDYWPGTMFTIVSQPQAEKIVLNGKALDGFAISHDKIIGGGTLEFPK